MINSLDRKAKESNMNWQDVITQWPEVCKKARSNWNKLSMDALAATRGERAPLSNLIQQQYDLTPQEADAQLEEWLDNLMGNTQDPVVKDPALDEKLDANLDTPETIEKRDEIVGSPYHKGNY
jgi:hypothetical protein